MRVLKPFIRWVLLLSLVSVPASGRSWLGTFFSPKAAGLSSVTSIGSGEDSFVRADILLDMNGVFRGWLNVPGLQLRVADEYVIARHEFTTGTGLRFLAGPGLTLGYVSDYDNSFGFLGGISAGMSLLFDFQRNVAVSFSMSADYCFHYRTSEGHPVLKSYRNGFLRAYYPEIRILYRF